MLKPTVIYFSVLFAACWCEVVNRKIEPVVLIHGGAGDTAEDNIPLKFIGMKKAVDRGYKALYFGGSVLDAVEAAVMVLEDDPVFNAGRGSVLNLDGEVEMEASIQRGSDLNAGSATLLKHFKNPVSIARKVLEKTPHNMLGGDGAKRFAISQGFEIIDPQTLITQEALDNLNSLNRTGVPRETRLDTVGAVAIDSQGRIAVATSSGGTNGKYVGRIGQAPLIGAGTFADDAIGGASCTGHGESIMKVALAHSIVTNLENGYSAQKATERALDYMTSRLNKTAGAIALSKLGDVGVYFTSKTMSWSYIKGNKIYWGINKGEVFSEFYSPFA